MKKFLSKKPVMITFIVLAVLGLALYIGMLARPVAYGFNYKNIETKGDVTRTFTINVKNSKKAVQKVLTESSSSTSETEQEIWIYVDGNTVVFVGPTKTITEDEYKAEVEAYKKAKKETPEDYKKELENDVKLGRAFKANAFKITIGTGDNTTEFKCAGSTIFAILGGIVEAVLIAGAVSTIVFVVRKKK